VAKTLSLRAPVFERRISRRGTKLASFSEHLLDCTANPQIAELIGGSSNSMCMETAYNPLGGVGGFVEQAFTIGVLVMSYFFFKRTAGGVLDWQRADQDEDEEEDDFDVIDVGDGMNNRARRARGGEGLWGSSSSNNNRRAGFDDEDDEEGEEDEEGQEEASRCPQCNGAGRFASRTCALCLGRGSIDVFSPRGQGSGSSSRLGRRGAGGRLLPPPSPSSPFDEQ